MKKQNVILTSIILLFAKSLFSQIIYTDIEPDASTTLDPIIMSVNGVVEIDFNNDGNAEFDFRWDDYSFIGYGYFSHITNPNNNSHTMWLSGSNNSYNAGYLQVVNENELIGPNLQSGLWGMTIPDPIIADSENNTFQELGDKYIGVQINLNGILHYGWIRVSFDENKTLTIKDYAYQSLPNTAILAGASQDILPESLEIEGENGVTTILNSQSLQMISNVLPSNASNQNVIWSVSNVSGSATINNTGLLTATSSGTVLVEGTILGTTITDTISIIINPNLITSLVIFGENNNSTVLIGQTLQMYSTIVPGNADNTNLTWTVSDQGGSATIADNGLLTGVTEGQVLVTASTNDGSNLSDTKYITVLPVNLDSISIYSDGFVTEIDFNESVQMSVIFYPENATYQEVSWDIVELEANASINQNGMVYGQSGSQGIVQVVATSTISNSVSDTFDLFINYIPITTIIVQGENGLMSVDEENDLQMEAIVSPSNATSSNVTWSVENLTGEATIAFDTGILTGVSQGTVKVIANAADGSGTIGDTIVTINELYRYITSIEVQGENGATSINLNGYLQMNATILPQNATNPLIAWTVVNNTGSAFINDEGLLSPTSLGDVIVKAVAQDGSNLIGQETINITQAVGLTFDNNEITKIFPNPTSSSIYVQSSKDIEHISLFSIDGKLIMEEKQSNLLNLNRLSNGSYLVKVNYLDKTSDIQLIMKQ
ncbi:MAG: Ig-like domain-containing protein [Flavobacteriales bacterium]|nr:Ig-like domain-containing protein [Flavobacteriales bacterium]